MPCCNVWTLRCIQKWVSKERLEVTAACVHTHTTWGLSSFCLLLYSKLRSNSQDYFTYLSEDISNPHSDWVGKKLLDLLELMIHNPPKVKRTLQTYGFIVMFIKYVGTRTRTHALRISWEKRKEKPLTASMSIKLSCEDADTRLRVSGDSDIINADPDFT